MKIKNTIRKSSINSKSFVIAKKLRQRMTDSEKTLWGCLRSNKLNGLHFRRQQAIDEYIVDFYCHDYGLIIEIDGEIHDSQKDYDQERDLMLTSQGFSVIRFSNKEIQDSIEDVLNKIQNHLTPLIPLPFREGGSRESARGLGPHIRNGQAGG
jgi:very-short-patch-repair endonuclease